MMTLNSIFAITRPAARLTLGAGALIVAAGCQSLLDVKNPNNIAESALANPAAAGPEANGVLAATTRMLSATTLVYAEATDEVEWIGSRDAWLQLDQGAIGDYINEFADGAFPFAGEARYLADETIKRLEEFDKAGTLAARTDLMRVYIYAAVVYSSIADMYDDFAFSNKTVYAAPVGRANMSRLYDTAVGYLDKALAIATTNGDRFNILALRARIKHGKGVWQKVTPKGSSAPASPLVNDAGAVADANSALAVATGDQAFDLPNNVEAAAGINLWFEINGRNESAPGGAYVVDPRHTANKYVAKILDPVSNTADVRVQARLNAFKAFGTQAGTLWITNVRELRLILAEAALASGDAAGFATQLNQVRALDNKPAYTAGTAAANQSMLAYERQAQLWLMRRRLMDMYRFGQKDAKWLPNSNYDSSFSQVGLLFPITNTERLANPCVADAAKCQ